MLRITGDLKEVKAIKHDIHKCKDFTFDSKVPMSQLNNYSSCITQFLMSMPVSLFIYSDKVMLSAVIKKYKSDKDLKSAITAFAFAIRRVKAERRRVMIFMMNFFYSISESNDINKMSFRL